MAICEVCGKELTGQQRNYCHKNCSAIAYRRRNSEAVRERYRFYHLERTYGVTKEQFLVLYEEQGGCCAVCKKSIKILDCFDNMSDIAHLDHDHKTNEIRGLLCTKCNKGLGHFDDNITALRNAAEYLEKFL